jgi:hypothetical protein
MSVAADGK